MPYGGCPPYTQIWNTPWFDIYSPTDADDNEDWGWDLDNLFGCTPYPCTVIFENVTQTFSVPNSYDVTVTDAGGATTSSNYEFYALTPAINNPINYLFSYNDCAKAMYKNDFFSQVLSNYISPQQTPVTFKRNIGGDSYVEVGLVTYFGQDCYFLNKPATYLISIENIAMECYEEYEFTLSISDIFASDYPQGHTPANGDSWSNNNDIRIFGTLEINPGVTFTISNSTIYFMDENSGIIIHPGGKLIVNNSTLRNRIYCDDPNTSTIKNWKGIQVLGTPTIPHPAEPFNPITNTDPNHGVLILQNSTIQNAKIAAVNTLFTMDAANNPMPDNNHTGGIIIANNQTAFINNEIGVYFMPFRFNNISRIQNCTFTANSNFTGTFSVLNQYIGIFMVNNSFTHPFTQNTFTNTLPFAEQGIGILNVSAKAVIGAEGQGNTFNGLYKAIDYYSLPSILRIITITGNTFTNVPKAITLNGGVYASVTQNTFNIAPLNDQTAYGILTDRATGFTLQNNYFTSSHTTTIGKTGIAIRAGGQYQNTVASNIFDGYLGIANFYEGNNPHITIDCNQYHHPVLVDWFINPWAPTDYLQNQGECEIDRPEKARRNSFKTAANGFYLHIANYTNTPFEYRAQTAQFLPTVNDETGSIINEISCFLTNQYDQCAVIDDCNPDCMRQRILTETDQDNRVELYTQLIKQLLYTQQAEIAKTDLEAENREAGDKILVATYTDELQPDSALLKLLQIPLTTQENIDFFNLYMELLNGIQPPAGSGKTMSAQEQWVRILADAQLVLWHCSLMH